MTGKLHWKLAGS